MPVYPNEVPTIQVSPPPEPMYHIAPAEISQYLINRGWDALYNGLWAINKDGLIGYRFEWPEALAYEIFKNFVMLKTSSE